MVLAAAFGLTLAGVVFFEGLLLIRDFFVTAMSSSPTILVWSLVVPGIQIAQNLS
jgi:hypothetical protein